VDEWWNITNRVAAPVDWKERSTVEGVIGDSLGLTTQLEERSVGCILGVMIGDILGTPLEGKSRYHIATNYKSVCHNFTPGQHMGLYHLPPRWGMYTDDTNATLALASSLVEWQGLLPIHSAHQYGRFWRSKPVRGYPESAKDAMRAVLKGEDIEKTGRLSFPDGSYANGGVMRIAPIGIAFRNASEDELYEVVRMAIISSHVHPEAIDAAFIQAYSIIWLSSLSDPSQITPLQFLEKLLHLSRVQSTKDKISRVIHYFNLTERPSIEKILQDLGDGFQIKAIEALACVLWGMVTHWNEPEKCMIDMVSYGGDTDTTCSIVAALCGALHGTRWIPKRWFDNCENGPRGRDYAIKLARELCCLDLKIIMTSTESIIEKIKSDSIPYNEVEEDKKPCAQQ